MVHVKKVEIFGFKSFGFKNTTVQFEPGLVSISGPNGSGKSNILDAIIFAMGENKPKVMRVDKLRSLIHDIEGSRRGPKMARSSVHFDNSDRKIPVDSDTVEITREMDAGGENTYYLNKKKTNRSHILDLLDMANAGLGQLNAVQQGTVTRISEFTSEEKRRTIEDLIGLSYFDEKKAESLKQLDDADRRLEIALAKMGEIKKRIDDLEEERNQKLRHDVLERELNRYKAIDAANRLKDVSGKKESKESSLRSITSEIATLGAQRGTIRSEIGQLESEKSEIMAKASDHARAKSALEGEIAAAMEQYEVDNSAISASKRRMGQIGSQIPGIRSDLEQADATRDELAAQISEAGESIAEINARKAGIDSDLEAVDAKRGRILKEQSQAAAKKSETDQKIKGLTEQLNGAKLKLSKLEHERTESKARMASSVAKLGEIRQSVEELAASKTKLESMIRNNNDSIAETKAVIGRLQSKKSKIISDMDEWGEILEKSNQAATRYESKIKTVKGFMHEDYTVTKLKEDAAQLGIEGLVYEMISWDKEYERPVLAVSSDWIKAIVVRDFATLLGIAESARSKNLSKLKIIPMDSIPKFKMDLPAEPGVVGVLADFVRCKPAYSELKTFLFGNVVLTDTRESAYSVSQSGYRAVTADGEYFEAKGGTVVIDINSKVSKLTKLISMSSTVEGLFESINAVRKYLLSSRNKIKSLDKSISARTDRLSMSEQLLASARENHSTLVPRIESATSVRAQVEKRIADMDARDRDVQSEIQTCESHVETLSERIALVEDNYAGGEQDRIASELSAVNAQKAGIEESYTAIANEYRDKTSHLTALEARDGLAKSQSERLRAEEISLNREREELQAKVAGLEAQIGPKTRALEALRQREQELIATSGSSVGQIGELDGRLRVLSGEDRDLTGKINALERQSDSLNRDMRDLAEAEAKLRGILSAFGFDRDMETFDVQPIMQGLSAELASLSALNAKAPETYLDVSHGYRSMSTRKNSLEEERNSIVRFIEGIEKDKRQTFLDAFDRVDKEIRLIFGKMTGGDAWLELQNEDDIFDSGISYLIQFPNKPKRESTSISGGEKTLAAIVFVLALQKLKPSPFYLFDEVDAHLDAPNSERLSNILEERAGESQFIMVSLKDSVVQKAKLIYGVFPKNGVSHVVTYKDKRMPSVRASG